MAGEVKARGIESLEDFDFFDEVSKMLRRFHQKKNKEPEDFEEINACLERHGLSTRF